MPVTLAETWNLILYENKPRKLQLELKFLLQAKGTWDSILIILFSLLLFSFQDTVVLVSQDTN